MGFYEDQVVPRFTDFVMSRRELTPIRVRVAALLEGDVVEIGFGSGLNVPHYPPAVTGVRAVDPATIGRKLAASALRRAACRCSTSASMGKPYLRSQRASITC
jgi:hypothetical protein